MAYNTPMVDHATALEVAVAYIESGIVPVLIAPPGVGKTTMAQSVADAMGAELRPIRLNNISPEDAAGLQYVDRQGERSVHLPPKWLPAADGSDGPVLVFIDEITQAADENRKAVMSALLERYLGETRVADNCWFMAAGNSADDGTNVYEFDRATADRFGIIRLRTNVVDWCNDYAPKHDVDIGIVAFLRLRPDAFEMSEEMSKGDDVIAPSPRTWVALDRFLKRAAARGLSEAAVKAGVMGKIGSQVGTAFLATRARAQSMRTIDELLAMKPEMRAQHTPEDMDSLWVHCQGMIWHATTLQGIVDVFELLDGFREIKDVPFYETRFTVAEMILNRAAGHEIDVNAMFEHPRLVQLMRRWRQDMRDLAQALPVPENGATDGETAQDVEPVAYAAAA